MSVASIQETNLSIEQLEEEIRAENGAMIPCACGCGQKRAGRTAHGQPARFIRGHNARLQRRRPVNLAQAAERFWSKIDFRGDCWEWTRSTTKGGYGTFAAGRGWKRGCAHRFAYELLVGPVPQGLELDHLCRTRRCVNPDHLDVVTPKTNTRRSNSPTALNSRKTHCLRGHAFTNENTRIENNGARACRACCAIRQRARRAAITAQRLQEAV